jgi:pilus assembly protein Flp/PilA
MFREFGMGKTGDLASRHRVAGMLGTKSVAAYWVACHGRLAAARSIPTEGRGCFRRAGRAGFIFASCGSRALSYVAVEGYDGEGSVRTKRLRHALRLCRPSMARDFAKATVFLKFKFATSPGKTRLTVDDQVVGRLGRFHFTKEMAMAKYLSKVSSFLREEDAPTMVEYGLMVALIAVVAIGAVTTLGTNISTHFTNIADDLAP